MKANELRIGNWVFNDLDNEQIQIEELSPFMNQCKFRWEWLNYIRPIPLTKEWLISIGFKEQVSNDHFFNIAIGGSMLSINPDNGVVWIERAKRVFNTPALIEHVHQLQNLYFALTGEELTESPTQSNKD